MREDKRRAGLLVAFCRSVRSSVAVGKLPLPPIPKGVAAVGYPIDIRKLEVNYGLHRSRETAAELHATRRIQRGGRSWTKRSHRLLAIRRGGLNNRRDVLIRDRRLCRPSPVHSVAVAHQL
jgi:hypothetical protein